MNSSPLPSDSITLSLPQTPISAIPAAVEIPECPPCPECPACSFDDIFFAVHDYIEYKRGNNINTFGHYPGTMATVFVVGENLSASDVVWDITWSLVDEDYPPLVWYMSGFVALIELNEFMNIDDVITATATVCSTTKSATLTMANE